MTVESIRERLLRTDDDFLLAIMDGTPALEQFDQTWASLRDDIEFALRSNLLDEDTIRMAHSTSIQVATFASAFHDLNLDHMYLTSVMMDDLGSLMGRLSLSDDPPPTHSCVETKQNYLMDRLFGEDCIEHAGISWLSSHLHNPYPSSYEIHAISKACAISSPAVSRWFSCARREIGWSAVKKEWFGGSRRKMVHAASQFCAELPRDLALSQDIEAAFTSIKENVLRRFYGPSGSSATCIVELADMVGAAMCSAKQADANLVPETGVLSSTSYGREDQRAGSQHCSIGSKRSASWSSIDEDDQPYGQEIQRKRICLDSDFPSSCTDVQPTSEASTPRLLLPLEDHIPNPPLSRKRRMSETQDAFPAKRSRDCESLPVDATTQDAHSLSLFAPAFGLDDLVNVTPNHEAESNDGATALDVQLFGDWYSILSDYQDVQPQSLDVTDANIRLMDYLSTGCLDDLANNDVQGGLNAIIGGDSALSATDDGLYSTQVEISAIAEPPATSERPISPDGWLSLTGINHSLNSSEPPAFRDNHLPPTFACHPWPSPSCSPPPSFWESVTDVSPFDLDACTFSSEQLPDFSFVAPPPYDPSLPSDCFLTALLSDSKLPAIAPASAAPVESLQSIFNFEI